MDATHDRRERLHEQASALYLQGDYADALAAWKRILEADPADERAAEGIQLCEMLDAENVEAAPGLAASTDGVLGLGDETERTLEQLDEALGSHGTDWMDDAPAGAGFSLSDPAEPAPSLVAPFPFELADPDPPDIDAPGPEATDAASARFDLDHLGLSAEDASADDATTDARASQSAAAELERRASELMSEAMQLYERGEREAALAALERLAILDEDNEAALTFAEHIRSDIESSGEQREPFGTVNLFDPDPAPPVPCAPVRSTPPPAEASGGAVRSTEPEVVGVDLDLDPEPSDDEVSVPGGRRTKAKLDIAAPRRVPPKWLLIGAGALVLGIAGFFLLRSDGGDAAETSPDAEVASGDPTRQAGLGPGAPSAKKGTPRQAKEVPPSPSAPPTADFDTLVESGRTAFEAQDYKAAVLAYSQALAVDSTSGEARERLNEAGTKYREQKAVEDSRAKAIDAFNRGGYVEALRLFYRLTPTSPEEQARINRYLRNGWYNLGIGSLRSGDCKTARDHLREAKQHDPEDEEVRQGLSLASKCAKSTLTTEEYESVRALVPRGLD